MLSSSVKRCEWDLELQGEDYSALHMGSEELPGGKKKVIWIDIYTKYIFVFPLHSSWTKEKLKGWLDKPLLTKIVFISKGGFTEVKVILSPANMHWRKIEKISDIEGI